MARPQTESVRAFILDRVAAEPRSVARRVAEAYGISRQAANRHLDRLVEEGVLEQAGQTRAREYRLRRTSTLSRELRVTPVLKPERLWDDHIAPVLAHDRPAVRDLCRGAFAEVMGNVIEHAGASWITFTFAVTARSIDLTISDDGRGLFAALARRIGAATARDAADAMVQHAQERSSDFPASRLSLLARNFESFVVASSGVLLEFDQESDAWVIREEQGARTGTTIRMRARRNPAHARAANAGDWTGASRRQGTAHGRRRE